MAVDYRGITIDIDGNTSKLSAKLKEIRDDAKYVYAGLKDVNSALKFDDDNVTLLTQKQTYLAQAIENTKKRIEAYQAGMAALSETAADNMGLTAEQNAQYDQLERSVIKCEQQIGRYEEELAALTAAERDNVQETETLAEQHEKLSGHLRNLGTSLQEAGTSLQEMGDAATVGITAPLVAGTKAAVDAAIELDSAYHDLTKTVNGTDEELQALKDSAIAMSETQPVSASELLQIEAMGAQLGYANDQLQGFAETVSGLSVATDLDAETAATQLAQFANITGMAQEDTDRFGSTIVALGNNLSTTESATTNMAMRIAAAGEQIGLSEADTLGLAAALASLGVNAEAGGTNISKIMSQIDKDVATSSDGVQAWAEAAGMSAEDFATAWQTSPIDALSAVFSGMANLTSEGSNLSVMLEDLGIKSNQAVDVAKRLTSGHETLTEAIQIANTAWQENTALTKEVESRNDSLASKIDILRNKAQNMLAEVGEPIAEALLNIMDAAQPVFDLLASGAKAFSDLSDGTQQLVVTAGAIAAAFGPVNSVFGRVLQSMGGVASGLGDVGAAIELAIEGAKSGEGALAGLAAGAEALSGALSGVLVSAGITAAIVAITAIIDQIEKWKQHQEDVTLATTGLADAMTAMDEAAAKYNESIDGAAKHTESFRDRINEVIEKQAELARSMGEEWAEIGEGNAKVERYVAQIDELAGKSKLSAEDVAVLKNAVGQFNELTGASVDVLDEQNGKLSLNAAQIHEIMDAWEQQQQVAQHQEDYNELLEQQALAHDALADATSNSINVQKDYGSEFNQYLATLANAPSNTYAYSNAMAELEAAVDEADEAVERAREGMAESEHTFSTVEAALVSAGTSVEELASLTDAQMAAIRKAFDGTAKSAVDALKEIQAAAKASASAAANGGETTTSTSTGSVTDNPEYKALQKLNAAKYKERQRAYDAEYNALRKKLDKEVSAQSKAFDKEYDAASEAYSKEYEQLRDSLQSQYDLRKSELDEIYKTQKAAYDQQYSTLKSQLEKEYSTLKSQLEKEYSTTKSQYDKQYSEYKTFLDKQVQAQRDAYSKQLESLKSELSKQIEAQRDANAAQVAELRKANDEAESTLKKSLDAQYKQRAKEVSREYSEYTKANAKVLKEAKAAYSRQTKAFKAETKDRIAAIKEEYEARKQTVAANDGTTGIDAQIKALKAETKAERDEIARREREQKISELRKAVEQAKTRRTRQDAEAALSEYLEQIAQEDREAERERLIESLEEKKSAIAEETRAKQAQLDQERDLVISEYETRRGIELEQLQATQDAAYELLSAELARQEELRKEKDDAYLESYRESLNNQLTVLQERNAAEEESLATRLASQLEQQREYNQSLTDSIAEQHAAEIEQMTESNAMLLEQMREQQTADLEQRKESNTAILEGEKERNQAQLDDLKSTNQASLEELATAHGNELQAISDANNEQLGALRDRQSTALGELREHNADVLGEMRTANSDQLSELKTAQSDALSELRDKQGTALSELKTRLKEGTTAIETEMTTQATTAGTKAEETTQAVDKGLEPMPQKARTRSDQTLQEVLAGINDMPWKTGDIGDKTGSTLHEKLGLFVPKIGARGTELKDEGVKKLDPLKGEYEKIGDEAGKSLESKLNDHIRPVGKKAEDTKDEANNKLKPLVKDWDDLGKDSGKKLGDGIDSKKTEVGNAAGNLKSSATTGLGNLDSDFRSKGTGAANSFINALDNANAYGAGSNLGSEASSGLSDSANANGVGENFASSFANGMGLVDVWNAAYNIGMNALDAIKNALGIASPSKEAKKVAKFFTQGIVVGLDGTAGDVEDSSKSLGDAMLDQLNVVDGFDTMRDRMTSSLMMMRDEQKTNFNYMLSDLMTFERQYVDVSRMFAADLNETFSMIDERMEQASVQLDYHSTMREKALKESFERALELKKRAEIEGIGSMLSGAYSAPARAIEYGASNVTNHNYDINVSLTVGGDASGIDINDLTKRVTDRVHVELRRVGAAR